MFRITAFLLALAGFSLGLAPLAPAQQIKLETEFRTLWWSDEQMGKFDPNKPPPKETEVVIDKWEYSDPVGVPHPDSMTAHIRVHNTGSTPAAAFKLVVQTRWKEGPARSKKLARWTAPRTLKTFPVARLEPGKETKVEVPIDIKTRMDVLDRRDWWPHELELIVIAQSSKPGSKPLARAVRPFPVFRGD
jgi:hypothetical protein